MKARPVCNWQAQVDTKEKCNVRSHYARGCILWEFTMRILVTGGSGFIGRVLVRHLIEAGHKVRVVDRAYAAIPEADLHVANLCQAEPVYGALKDIEAVVHFGNHSNQARGSAQTVIGENTQMNANVFQAMADMKITRVIYASSVQAMTGWPGPNFCDMPAPPHALPVDGDTPPYPGNAYGLSKVLAEEMLRYYARVYSFSAVALRLPVIIAGQNQQWREHFIVDDRGRKREFGGWLWVDDVASLVLAILASNLPGFRIYHPSGALPDCLPDAESLARKYLPDSPRRNPGKPLACLIDTSRITEQTGWIPTPFDQLPERSRMDMMQR